MAVLKVHELMTVTPEMCAPHDSLEKVARLMVARDCGAIPVIDDLSNRQPVGILTDRDIVVRAVAKGKSVFDCAVQDVMSPSPITLHVDASFHECARTMMLNRFRRILVVDDRGRLVGIVTDGDLARACHGDPVLEHELAEMVEEVSLPRYPPDDPPLTDAMTGTTPPQSRPPSR